MLAMQKLAICYVIRLLLGVAMLALMWEVEGTVAFIAGMAGALIAFWNLMLLGILAESHAARKYPEYNTSVIFDNKLEKWLHRLSYFIFYATILSLGVFGPPLENHIKSNNLLVTYGLLGATLAIISVFLLKKLLPAFFKNNHTRAVAILGLWLSIFTWTAIAAGHYNIITAKKDQFQKVAFVQQKTKNVSTGTHYLYLQLDSHRERFSPEAKEWKDIAAGDTIRLTVGTGELGYTYIFSFTPNN